MLFIFFVPAVVFVKVLEGSVKVIFSVHPVHVHGGSDKLTIVYGTISICVRLSTVEL